MRSGSEVATANVCMVSCHVVRGGGHMARLRGWPVEAESGPQLTARKQKDHQSYSHKEMNSATNQGAWKRRDCRPGWPLDFSLTRPQQRTQLSHARVPDPQQVWNNTHAHLSHGIWGHLVGSNRKLIQIGKCLAHSRPAVHTVDYISDFVFKGFPGVRGYM